MSKIRTILFLIIQNGDSSYGKYQPTGILTRCRGSVRFSVPATPRARHQLLAFCTGSHGTTHGCLVVRIPDNFQSLRLGILVVDSDPVALETRMSALGFAGDIATLRTARDLSAGKPAG